MEATTHTKTKSVPSFDNITASELKLRPLVASQWLAKLFQLIEEGHKWPDTTLQAKAVWLLKTKSDPSGQLSSRTLIIASAIYRRWAGARVRQLQPWTMIWAPDELFSGVPAKDFCDAAYTSAAEAEAARHQDKDVTSIAFDLSKAVGKIPRSLIYAAAIKLGIPPASSLPTTIISKIYGQGMPWLLASARHKKRTISILKGCPLSMMWLSMFTSPWEAQIKALQGIPIMPDRSVKQILPKYKQDKFIPFVAWTWIYIHAGLKGQLTISKMSRLLVCLCGQESII